MKRFKFIVITLLCGVSVGVMVVNERSSFYNKIIGSWSSQYDYTNEHGDQCCHFTEMTFDQEGRYTRLERDRNITLDNSTIKEVSTQGSYNYSRGVLTITSKTNRGHKRFKTRIRISGDSCYYYTDTKEQIILYRKK